MSGEGQTARPWHPAIMAAAALGAVAVLAVMARVSLETGISWPCLFLNATGYPCFTCGTTRALAAAAQFNLGEAFRYNPLVMSCAVGVLALPFVKKYISGAGAGLWIGVIALVALNWVYLFLFLPH